MRYIEERTIEILKKLNITEAPVNPSECAQSLGVKVVSTELENDVSGLFVIKDGIAFIMFNKSESEHRQRFTIAHELGHFLLHKKTSLFIDKTDIVLYRNSESTTGALLKEREANAFAASLLMPKSFIEQEIVKKGNDKNIVSHLATKFNVSELAMSFRLSNLGYEVGW
ncbi:MAG: ImmA/IrrE family metallo-endopeptidase [Pelobium sp.]